MSDRLTRIAIVSSDRCKPKKCRQECKKSCPVVKTGKLFLPFMYLHFLFVGEHEFVYKLLLLSHVMDQSAGKLCIEVTTASKIAFISEELCIGCGICVKVRTVLYDFFCCFLLYCVLTFFFFFLFVTLSLVLV